MLDAIFCRLAHVASSSLCFSRGTGVTLHNDLSLHVRSWKYIWVLTCFSNWEFSNVVGLCAQQMKAFRPGLQYVLCKLSYVMLYTYKQLLHSPDINGSFIPFLHAILSHWWELQQTYKNIILYSAIFWRKVSIPQQQQEIS